MAEKPTEHTETRYLPTLSAYYPNNTEHRTTETRLQHSNRHALRFCQRMAEKPTKRTENHFLPLRCKAFVIECKVYANLSPIKVKFV